MVALRGRDIDAYLARPDPSRPIVLLFGPDTGLVAERADALVKTGVDNPNDPFALVRLEGDELARDKARLVDEALTVPLFGGRRVIRVRALSGDVSKSVEGLTAAAIKDCLIVIEAGDLKRDSALRGVCERAKNAVAIPCYVDNARDIARLIETEMREARLNIAPDVRDALVGLLGGDRLASRNEIRKLALYAAGRREVTLDDVRAVVTDASQLALDPVIDGTFAGRPAEVERAFSKSVASGMNPAPIMSAVQRQAAQLHRAHVAIAGGMAAAAAKESHFPRLHFSRSDAIDSALRNWNAPRMLKAMTMLAESARDMRRRPALAEAIALQAFLTLANAARARR